VTGEHAAHGLGEHGECARCVPEDCRLCGHGAARLDFGTRVRVVPAPGDDTHGTRGDTRNRETRLCGPAVDDTHADAVREAPVPSPDLAPALDEHRDEGIQPSGGHVREHLQVARLEHVQPDRLARQVGVAEREDGNHGARSDGCGVLLALDSPSASRFHSGLYADLLSTPGLFRISANCTETSPSTGM